MNNIIIIIIKQCVCLQVTMVIYISYPTIVNELIILVCQFTYYETESGQRESREAGRWSGEDGSRVRNNV